MLDYIGWKDEAAAVEAAVAESVTSGNGTAEIGGSLGTKETGDFIARVIRRTFNHGGNRHEPNTQTN
jgi:isocitrate/isopropylmalate dehydrogenase